MTDEQRIADEARTLFDAQVVKGIHRYGQPLTEDAPLDFFQETIEELCDALQYAVAARRKYKRLVRELELANRNEGILTETAADLDAEHEALKALLAECSANCSSLSGDLTETEARYEALKAAARKMIHELKALGLTGDHSYWDRLCAAGPDIRACAEGFERLVGEEEA